MLSLVPEDAGVVLLPGRYRLTISGQTIESMEGSQLAVDDQVVDIFHGFAELTVRVESTAELIRLEFLDETGGKLPPIVIDELDSSGRIRCLYCGTCTPPMPCIYSVVDMPAVLNLHAGGDIAIDPQRLTVSKDDVGVTHVVHLRQAADRHKLRGHAVDASTGAPVSGAIASGVVSCTDGSNQQFSTMADAGGEFAIPCPEECTARLTLRTMDGRYATLEGLDPSCSGDEIRTFSLERAARVAGNVRDESDNPVVGLRLALAASDSRSLPPRLMMQGATDDHGRFEFDGLARGRYLVVLAQRDDAFLVDASGKPAAVDVKTGASTEDLRLQLVRAGRICMEAVDGSGRPIPLDSVEVHEITSPGGETAPPSWRRRRLQAQGPLCAGPLRPGTYLLYAGERNGEFIPAWWPGESRRERAVPIDVVAGDDRYLPPLRVVPAGMIEVQIDGSLIADRDRPVVSLLELSAAETREHAGKTATDEKRRFELVEDERILISNSTGPTLKILSVPEGRWLVRLCRNDSRRRDDAACRIFGPVLVRRGVATTINVRAPSRTVHEPVSGNVVSAR